MDRAIYYKYNYEIVTPDGEHKKHEGFEYLPAQYNHTNDETEAHKLILQGTWRGIGETTDKYGFELLSVDLELISELDWKRYEKQNREHIQYNKAKMKAQGWNY